MSSTLTEIVESCRSAQSVILTSHTSPDGDAIGSVFGFSNGLQKLGIATTVYLADGVPDRFRDIVDGAPFVTELPDETFDLAVAVDNAAKSRVGPQHDAFFCLGAKTLNVDHHVSNDRYAHLNYIEGTASTAQLVLRILVELGVQFDTSIANLLYTGLADDTASFRHANTGLREFEDAADLVRRGADSYFISQQLFSRLPARVMRLRAAALSQMHLHADGRIAIVRIPRSLMEEVGASEIDTGGLVDEVRSLEGVMVGVTIREGEKGWKASLRSDSVELDVNQVASKFGGGGHKVAAGCVIQGTGEQVEEQLLSALKQMIDRCAPSSASHP